jgi:hypothetical protein
LFCYQTLKKIVEDESKVAEDINKETSYNEERVDHGNISKQHSMNLKKVQHINELPKDCSL